MTDKPTKHEETLEKDESDRALGFGMLGYFALLIVVIGILILFLI